MEVVILKRWCLDRSISIVYKFAREVNLTPISLLSKNTLVCWLAWLGPGTNHRVHTIKEGAHSQS